MRRHALTPCQDPDRSGAPAVRMGCHDLEPVLRVRGHDPARPGKEVTLTESAPAEGREIEVGPLFVEDNVGEDVADDRRVLEAVATPPKVGVESRIFRDGPKHRLMI